MNDDLLCPFSKPILGNWCQCRHAVAADRCAGKMYCTADSAARASCHALVDMLREKGRFVLGVDAASGLITHAQLMKLRCGGLRGMQRVLKNTPADSSAPPAVLELIALAEHCYGQLADFPFSEIVRDINAFSHRKRP